VSYVICYSRNLSQLTGSRRQRTFTYKGKVLVITRDVVEKEAVFEQDLDAVLVPVQVVRLARYEELVHVHGGPVRPVEVRRVGAQRAGPVTPREV
jgi:hypothetical protein